MWVLVSYGGVVLFFVCRQQKWASHKCHARLVSLKSGKVCPQPTAELMRSNWRQDQLHRCWENGEPTPQAVHYTHSVHCAKGLDAIFVMSGCARLDTAPYGRLIIAWLRRSKGWNPPSPPSRPLCSTHVSPRSITLLTCPSNSQLHQRHIWGSVRSGSGLSPEWRQNSSSL